MGFPDSLLSNVGTNSVSNTAPLAKILRIDVVEVSGYEVGANVVSDILT